MKKLILFGAGKSATSLIDYLIEQATKLKWQVTVVDSDPLLARAKVGKTPYASVETFSIEDDSQRSRWISQSDLVISLLPPSLHTLIARDCLRFSKHLLTASYISEEIRQMAPEIEKAGILFMGEMGLDPGIDHMSAMNILDSIQKKGGEVLSFKSYCGALIAPECDDNPWRYKFSWNPQSVITAGQQGADFREAGTPVHLSYEALFENCKSVDIPGLGKMAYYPNRNSLQYASLYKIDHIPTVLRATLRYPEFCEGWHALIRLGLTKDKTLSTDGLSFRDWTLQAVPHHDAADPEGSLAGFLGTDKYSGLIRQFKFLGLLDPGPVNLGTVSNQQVLLHLMQEKLRMKSSDRDMVIMLHELEFERKNIRARLSSYLIVLGEDNLRTAIAKTVGLPLGILAKLILTNKVTLTGLHIPVLPEVYQPVLKELEEYGVRFEEFFN